MKKISLLLLLVQLIIASSKLSAMNKEQWENYSASRNRALYIDSMNNDEKKQMEFQYICGNGENDKVKLLLNSIPSSKRSSFINMPCLKENPLKMYGPLHQASYAGHSSVVSTLCEYGTNVNILSYNGYKPLDFAVIFGHYDVAKQLLAYGATITVHDWTNTQIHKDIIALLSSHNIKINTARD